MRSAAAIAVALILLGGVGCSLGEEREGAGVNPTPTKENGEPSYQFEPEDIERAEEAPESVRRYCEGAVSEAQEVGCLSHVNPSEVP